MVLHGMFGGGEILIGTGTLLNRYPQNMISPELWIVIVGAGATRPNAILLWNNSNNRRKQRDNLLIITMPTTTKRLLSARREESIILFEPVLCGSTCKKPS